MSRHTNRPAREPRGARRDAAAASNAGGFTLIETLVAIVILSTGIVLVLRAFQTSAVALGEARDQAVAMTLIGRRFEAAEAYTLDHPGMAPRDDSGAFDPPYDRFLWQQETESAERAVGAMAFSDEQLTCVRVAVWREGRRRRYVGETFVRTFEGTPAR